MPHSQPLNLQWHCTHFHVVTDNPVNRLNCIFKSLKFDHILILVTMPSPFGCCRSLALSSEVSNYFHSPPHTHGKFLWSDFPLTWKVQDLCVCFSSTTLKFLKLTCSSCGKSKESFLLPACFLLMARPEEWCFTFPEIQRVIQSCMQTCRPQVCRVRVQGHSGVTIKWLLFASRAEDTNMVIHTSDLPSEGFLALQPTWPVTAWWKVCMRWSTTPQPWNQ